MICTKMTHPDSGGIGGSDIVKKTLHLPMSLMENVVIVIFYLNLLTFIKILFNPVHQVLIYS